MCHTCPVCGTPCLNLTGLRSHFFKDKKSDTLHQSSFKRLQPESAQRVLKGGSYECSCGAIFNKKQKMRQHLQRNPGTEHVCTQIDFAALLEDAASGMDRNQNLFDTFTKRKPPQEFKGKEQPHLTGDSSNLISCVASLVTGSSSYEGAGYDSCKV